MKRDHASYHLELAKGTRSVFILLAICIGLAAASALFGATRAVVTFKQASFGVGYAFGLLLALLILSAAIGAVLRWTERRTSRG